MTKDLDKIIKICQQYADIVDDAPFEYGHSPRDIISACKVLKSLGFKWGESIVFVDFRIVKNPYITNSSTHYSFDENQYYVVWDNGNVGRLQFVSSDYYDVVADEWAEFRQRLLDYDPVDYDKHNCNNIYDIENGKRLMEDYPRICKETREKMKAKIAKAKLEKVKREYESLLAEVEDGST